MTNITVLKDEIGLQREYREVKRKAAVGDYLVFDGTGSGITENKPYLVVDLDHDGGEFVDDDGDTRWQAHIIADCTVIEPPDVVRIDGERYRLVERKANVGERVVVTKKGTHSFAIGDTTEIVEVNEEATHQTRRGSGHICGWLYESQYRFENAVASAKLTVDIGANPDVIGLIANLSTRLAEAERKIAALEGAKAANEAPDVLISRPLKRDDIIERAKADVADLLCKPRNVHGEHSYFWPKVDGQRTSWVPMQRVDFVVNREKRTVVALIRYLQDGELFARGIAKCAPDDVFNTHIGRAIALRRALGLDVPDAYVNAPKPTEAKVGDIVRWIGQNGSCRKDSEILTIKERYYPRGDTAERAAWRFSDGAWDYANSFEILDDSREETEVTA